MQVAVRAAVVTGQQARLIAALLKQGLRELYPVAAPAGIWSESQRSSMLPVIVEQGYQTHEIAPTVLNGKEAAVFGHGLH